MPVQFGPVLRVVDPCGPTYYLGTMLPGDIKLTTFVPVQEARDHGSLSGVALNEIAGGYQRWGEPRRMDAIKQFVAARIGCLIPPVVLSTRGKWQFLPDAGRPDTGSLIADECAAIVDGQHRLGGLWRLNLDGDVSSSIKKKPIPFLAVDDLDVEQETVEFVDINDNQKGVKKSLIAWLQKDSTFAGSVALAMGGDDESVFKGRIGPQRKREWDLILFGAAKECVSLTFGVQLRTTKALDPEKDVECREACLEMFLRYWRLVRSCFHDLWSDIDLLPAPGESKSKSHPGTTAFRFRLLEETGIRAVSRLAEKVFVATWISQLQEPSWEAVEAAMRALGARDRVRLVLTKPHRNPAVLQFDPNLRSSGKAGVDAIFRHLESELLAVWQLNG